jgi:hypothetical protein
MNRDDDVVWEYDANLCDDVLYPHDDNWYDDGDRQNRDDEKYYRNDEHAMDYAFEHV